MALIEGFAVHSTDPPHAANVNFLVQKLRTQKSMEICKSKTVTPSGVDNRLVTFNAYRSVLEIIIHI